MQIFPLLIIGLVLALDWYAFQGIRTVTADVGRWRMYIHLAYWLVTATIVVTMVMGANPVFRSTLFFKIVGNLFIALFVAKLVFILILFGEDIFRVISGIVQSTFDTRPSEKSFLPGRRKFISQIGLGLASLPFASVLYGIFKGKYDYTVHRTTLYFKNLPAAFDGFKILQLSDIHAGSFDNFSAVQRGVELANAQGADLFVFTGDLVNNLADEMEPWVELFSQIRAPFGQYSILGNHDYGEYFHWENLAAKQANFEAVKNLHQQLGYRLLLNENLKIEKGGSSIRLIGVENWGKGFIQRGNLDEALEGVEENEFRVLLSHDPSYWEERIKTGPQHIDLTLSGHTHGMQFGIEIPGFKWSPVKYLYPHWAGKAEEYGRTLYVNRGFGFLGFSGRVGIWPEIGVLELRRQE